MRFCFDENKFHLPYIWRMTFSDKSLIKIDDKQNARSGEWIKQRLTKLCASSIVWRETTAVAAEMVKVMLFNLLLCVHKFDDQWLWLRPTSKYYSNRMCFNRPNAMKCARKSPPLAKWMLVVGSRNGRFILRLNSKKNSNRKTS